VDDEYEPLSLQDAFGELKDPRVRIPEHDLTEMLVVALAAILSPCVRLLVVCLS
jgi:hypothetical protein